MYNEKVFEIFQNPKNMGEIRNANAVGKVGNPVCGDIMKIYMMIEDGKIVDAKFKTFGCVAAIVSSSVATELIKGLTIEEALSLSNQEIIKELGDLPPQKVHCSVLAKEAIQDAVNNYYKNQKKQMEKEKKSVIV